jgi:hypothetical protein
MSACIWREATNRKGIQEVTERTALEMALADAVKNKMEDNGVEFLVGALSSITTESQLKALLEGVKSNG